MENIISKDIYEKEKDKLSISYNEFISIINELFNSSELMNKIIENNSKEISITQTNLTSNTNEISENSIHQSISTSSSSSSNNLVIENSDTINSSTTDSLFFDNKKINILKNIQMNDDKTNEDLNSSEIDNESLNSISTPSDFTIQKPSKLNFNNNSLNDINFFESTEFTDTTISSNSTNSIIFTDFTINSELKKNIEQNKIKKNYNSKQIKLKNINIKINPKLKYNLNINFDDNIDITIT